MSHTGKILAAATMALMLSGCGGVVILDEVGPRWDYFDGDFAYANHKGLRLGHVDSPP